MILSVRPNAKNLVLCCVVVYVVAFFAPFAKIAQLFSLSKEISWNDNVVMIINIWKEWKKKTKSFKWENFHASKNDIDDDDDISVNNINEDNFVDDGKVIENKNKKIRSQSCLLCEILARQEEKHFYQTNKFSSSETWSYKPGKKLLSSRDPWPSNNLPICQNLSQFRSQYWNSWQWPNNSGKLHRLLSFYNWCSSFVVSWAVKLKMKWPMCVHHRRRLEKPSQMKTNSFSHLKPA